MTETKTFNLPPGKFGLPLIGETVDFLKDPDFAAKRHRQYGDVFKSNFFGKPTIFVKGAEATQFVLSNENKYFVVSFPPSTKALLGSLSLALQTGGKHTQRRKMLYQAFAPRALDSYIPVMVNITQQYLQQWAKQDPLVWYPQLRYYTFDIACKLFMGLDNGSNTQLGHWFETWCQGLFSLPIRLPWTKFGKAFSARENILQELETIIRQRQQGSDLGDDALSLLIQAKDEEGNPLSVQELKEQILLLLFAGHETLTSAVSSFCLLLAQNPEVLAKVREEQSSFDLEEALTLDELRQMTYLEQVLREVLRIIPPVGGVFREVIQTCEFRGYSIPKGWTVLNGITQTHKTNEIYSSPDTFNPDRFSAEREEDKQKAFSYIPFGGGLRECIGKEFARLELKIFATLLCRQYEWELLPNQDLSLVTIPTPKPRDELQVRLKPLPSLKKKELESRG